MGRFRRFARRPKVKRPTKWTSVVIDTLSTTGNDTVPAEASIVVAADYGSNTALSPSGVSCIRVVGTIQPIYTMGSAFTAASTRIWSAAWGIAHIDSDEASTGFDPHTAQNLIDERWLLTGMIGTSVRTETVEGIVQLYAPPIPVDIRQRVRLRDSGISIFVSQTGVASSAAAQISWECTFRALLQGDMD